MTRLQVGNYVFSSADVLGKGSTGTVYLGHDIRNGGKVAIKAIKLNTINNEVTKYLLQNEVKALQMVNHPNVLHAYNVIADPNCYYVVTNYCLNGTLEDYVKKKGRIPEEEAIKIFKQIVEGYVSIRAKNILHRDLKPSNILFSQGSKPVICDFGYCQIAGFLPKPKVYYNVGSPAYMAPETITKNQYSQQGEVWSLGTIYYEMLQGRSFCSENEVMEAIMRMKMQGPYYPDGASELSKKIIRQCMNLFPSNRIKLKDLQILLNSGQPRGRQISHQQNLAMTTSVQYFHQKVNNNIVQSSDVKHIDINSLNQNIHQKPSILSNQNPPIPLSAIDKLNELVSDRSLQKKVSDRPVVRPSILTDINPDISNNNSQIPLFNQVKSSISKPDAFPQYKSNLFNFDENFKIPDLEIHQFSSSTSMFSITDEMNKNYIKSNLQNIQHNIPGAIGMSYNIDENYPLNGIYSNYLTAPDSNNIIKKQVESNSLQNEMLNSSAFLHPTGGTFAKNMALHQINPISTIRNSDSKVNLPNFATPQSYSQITPQNPSTLLISFSNHGQISAYKNSDMDKKVDPHMDHHMFKTLVSFGPNSSAIPGTYYPQSNLNYSQLSV